MLAARTEHWLPVPDWPGYEASTRGRVRSVERTLADGRTAGSVVLTPLPDRDGYLYVTLRDGGRSRRFHVARLVLLAHAGPPPQDGMEALHGNSRRRDCRLANLRWGTRIENRADRDNRQKEKRARAARRAARAAALPGVAEESERETGEIDGAACCPVLIVSPGSQSRRSWP